MEQKERPAHDPTPHEFIVITYAKIYIVRERLQPAVSATRARIESHRDTLSQSPAERGDAGGYDPMQKPVLAPLAMLLASLTSAHGAEQQVGRYQMIAVPASQSQTFPETLLMDTATGQTWIRYHETGQSIEWLPSGFRPERTGQPRRCRRRRMR
jgi:hypothetical protein